MLLGMIKIRARTKYTNGADYDPTERSWYKDAMNKQGGIVVTEPYKAQGNGHIVVTIAKQTEDKNGVVAIDLSLDNLLKTTKLINIGKRDMRSF